MMNSHPTGFEIQQYGLDPAACSRALTDHIDSCAACRAEAEAYQLVISGIKQEPKAVFDFDLPALVMQQLPQPAPRFSADRFIAGFLVIFISCFTGIPVILFHRYILNMFTGIPPFFIYSMIACASVIVGFKTLDMYRKYKAQMRLINFNQII
ncbi:MAG TPA: hypothetical protein DIC22_09030 [Chitinophagaceae bacterium]|nr:hypothetical protein [Chitinophagaceae bacterium]